MSFLKPSTLLLTLLTISSTLACGPSGPHQGRDFHQRGRRAAATTTTTTTKASTSKAPVTTVATVTTTGDVSTSTNAAAECAGYDFPVVDAIIQNYPAIWANAQIVANDTEALNAFKALEPLIPNITVKGTPTGDFNVSANYPSTDPDCWWTSTTCTTPKHPGLSPDVVECPENDVLGLTFDDGPNCSHNAFYDYLLSQNQKASMFFIGSNVMDWPLQAQRALTDGHEICVHTWSHPYMTGMTNEGVFAELWYTMKAIKQVIGITPRCWRPPFGDVDDRVRFIAAALDLTPIIWLEDTDDWDYAVEGLDKINANYQNIVTKGTNGTYNHGFGPIMLSHEIDGETMLLAQEWHPKLAAAYSHLVPVNVCRNNTKPYVEPQYQYPDYAAYIAGTTTITTNPSPTADANVVITPAFHPGQTTISSPLAYQASTSAATTTTTTTTTVAATTSASNGSSSTSGVDPSKETGSKGSAKSGAVGGKTIGVWGVLVGMGVGLMMI